MTLHRTAFLFAAALSGLAWPLIASQAPTTGTALILGQVIDAATSQPISDATVALAGGRGRGAPPAADASGRPPAPTTIITGADGRFVFRDVGRGSHPLTVTAFGYLEGRAGQGRPGGPARLIEIGDGEKIGDVTIRLWRVAVLRGTVTDEAGEPAVRVTVHVLRRRQVGGRAAFVPVTTAQTDDRGMYRVSSLEPGDYVVALPMTQTTMPAGVLERFGQAALGGGPPPMELMDLIASSPTVLTAGTGIRVGDLLWSSSYAGAPGVQPDGTLLIYPTIFYPGATAIAQAASITLRSGEERSGVDLQMRLATAVRVGGIVTGPDGPAPSVVVRLVPADESGSFDQDVAAAATTADGSFTLLGVPPGRYVARVVRNPTASMMARLFSGGAASGGGPPAPALSAVLPVAVGTADVTGLSLALREGARVSGRVEFEGSARPTADEIAQMNISVRLNPTGRASMPGFGPGASATVDGAGRFSIPGQPPGEYLVAAGRGRGAAAGPATWSAAFAMHDGRDLLAEPFRLEGTDVDDLVITFTDRPARLTGAVTSGGAPARTATVVAVPADYRGWIAAGMPATRARLAPASRQGSYSVAGLRPGDYLVAAVDDSEAGELSDPAFIEAIARIGTRVTIGPGEQSQPLQVVKVVR
jgi:hypothetical protein